MMQTVRIGQIEIGKGTPKIIAPITSPTIESARASAEMLADFPVDLVEWRIDMLEGAVQETSDGFMPDLSFITDALESLHAVSPVPLIGTFRTMEEGGSCPISEQGYCQLIKHLCSSRKVSLVDVEAFHKSRQAEELISYAHSCRIPVIASCHNFRETPAKEDIVGRLRSMQDDLGGDILKIAVMPGNRADVITLLTATEEMTSKYAHRPVIAISMGALGVASRVCGHLFGSAATFASMSQRASAPGQLDVNSTKSVLNILTISERASHDRDYR